MPKLFISYRRKSWPFTHRLADELRARLESEIFVDFTGIDEADFEKSILRHLRESTAVLLVISPETFVDRIHKDDDWVRREIREALTQNIPLVLVCVEGLLPPSGLPDDIKDVARMQGINFYPEYFHAAVDKLSEFVVKIGAANKRSTPPAQPAVTPSVEASVKQKSISGRTTLSDALDLLDAGDHAKAIFLLESLRESGYQSNVFNLNDLLRKARDLQAADERRRIALLNYDDIAELAARRVSQAEAEAAFRQWCADFPDLVAELDTRNLRERFASPSVGAHRDAPAIIDNDSSGIIFHEVKTETLNFDDLPPEVRKELARKPPIARPNLLDILPPPFEWVKIPAGPVTLEKGGYLDKPTTFDVPAFAIAKYPITNAQFQVFIDAKDGYGNTKWWDFSEDAKAWRKENTQPEKRAFPGDDHPRANVSWYESVAFCFWLNSRFNPSSSQWGGAGVGTPTEQQWQRAAQALPDGRDSGYTYPWGNDFDPKRCNTSESNIRGTTPVTQYPQGASSCGVMDLNGNVWEWCLTSWESGKSDLNGTGVRLLRGGSFLVSELRARAASRFQFDPGFGRLNIGFRVVWVGSAPIS